MGFTLIFQGLKNNTLTIEEAAQIIGLSEKELEKRIGIWGRRLESLFKVFDGIQNDTISRSEASRKLNVSVREVNHLMVSWKVSRPLKDYLLTRASSKIKWELHKKWAIGYIAEEYTIEEAALGSGLSTRQVRRWISELLDKHYGMVFKDLKTLNLARRRRLADEIETAEGIELSKRKVLEAISSGDRTLEQEALDRVLSKRNMSERRKHVRRGTDKENR